MITRYSRPEMAAIWSDEHKLELWQEVEALIAEAWEAEGVAPAQAGSAIRSAPAVTPAEVVEREAETNHDVAAFVDLLSERAGDSGRWVHYGATSSDLLDTAAAVRLAEAAHLLIADLASLFEVVRDRALEHRDTQMVGRTHGVWAEPTTFGLKLATWAFELARDFERMTRARSAVAVGKISGAVGTYAHVPPSVEAYVCERLNLAIEPASSQITHRDRHAEYLQALAIIGASLERFATEIRHLARSEVAEVQESFGGKQKGSSAMPHKRNPITAERITGLARVLRGYAQVGLENVALWHERDISHSSAERVVLPDASLIADYMLATTNTLIRDLEVNTARMGLNLQATHGLVYSQAVLLSLVDAGLDRESAYRIVQRNATQAWDEGLELHALLAQDPKVTLSANELAECFSADRFLRNIGVVFDRLGELRLGP